MNTKSAIKNINPWLLVVVAILVTTFYWYGYRPSSIKKSCYSEAFRLNETNAKWADGKIWSYIDGEYGWVYPGFDLNNLYRRSSQHTENRNVIYRQCLMRKGL